MEEFGLLVNFHVSSEVGPVSKLLSTVSTPVRLLSGVRPHVTLEQPGPRESLVTDLTLVAEVVGQDVHLERRGGHVFLVADVAGLGILCRQQFVSLLVTREVGASGEVLPTLLTLVLGF